MRCLCCGKDESDFIFDSEAGWHKKCIRSFFGTKEIPYIDLSDKTFEALAIENTNNGYTVPGVQKKLSLHLDVEDRPRLTLMNYPTGYILKPQVEDFNAMPESEQLVMNMAEGCGISTVPHALVKLQIGQLAYITKRVDRKTVRGGKTEMYAMEDFCQLDLRLTGDKYRGAYERCAKIIIQYSSRSGLDLSELYLRLIFSFLTGNSDMHLKNFSLIETSERSGQYTLSPAYDLLPVNLLMPEDKEQFALTMNGKKSNLRRSDFLTYAENCGIKETAAVKMLDSMISKQKFFHEAIEKSWIPDEMKNEFKVMLDSRITSLFDKTKR